MGKRKVFNSMKRFGTRYGKPLKDKYGATEETAKQEYKCPQCHMIKVKRVACGIWECRKCGLKFAGKAYSVAKKIKIKEEVQGIEKEEEIEETKDDEEKLEEQAEPAEQVAVK